MHTISRFGDESFQAIDCTGTCTVTHKLRRRRAGGSGCSPSPPAAAAFMIKEKIRAVTQLFIFTFGGVLVWLWLICAKKYTHPHRLCNFLPGTFPKLVVSVTQVSTITFMQMTHNFSSLFIYPIFTLASPTSRMLYNKSLLGWLLIY